MDVDPVDNLDPRCSWSWKSGYQRACTFYDFEHCENPRWPTSCPVLSVRSSSGCVKYWCPDQNGGQLVTTSTPTSSTEVFSTTMTPENGFPVDYSQLTPTAKTLLVIMFVLTILWAIGSVIWKRMLRQYQKDRILDNLKELGLFFARLLYCFLPLLVCLLFPLITLIYGAYRGWRNLYSATVLNRRKRPGDWTPTRPPQSPSLPGFSGFHTTVASPSGTGEPTNLHDQVTLPSQVTLDHQHQVAIMHPEVQVTLPPQVTPEHQDEVAIMLPNAQGTLPSIQERQGNQDLSLASLVTWRNQFWLSYMACLNWFARWCARSEAAEQTEEGIDPFNNSNIRWVDGTLQDPATTCASPHGQDQPAGLISQASPQGQDQPAGLISQASPQGKDQPSTSGSSNPRVSSDSLPAGASSPETPGKDRCYPISGRYQSSYARRLARQIDFSGDEDFSMEIFDAPQSTPNLTLDDSFSSFVTAKELSSAQSESSGYTALNVTARYLALGGPRFHFPSSAHNLTTILEETVTKIRSKSESSSNPELVRTGPPPPPPPKPDFRAFYREEMGNARPPSIFPENIRAVRARLEELDVEWTEGTGV